MKTYFLKFLSLFLLVEILALNSLITIYLHKCYQENLTYVSIFRQPECDHIQADKSYSPPADKNTDSKIFVCQTEDCKNSNFAEYPEFMPNGYDFCCFNQQLVLQLSGNLFFQKLELQTKNLNFEYLPFSSFRDVNVLKSFLNQRKIQAFPVYKELILAFIQTSSQDKSRNDLPPFRV